MNSSFKTTFLAALKDFREGFLELICGDCTYEFGDRGAALRGTVVVHNERLFRRALLGGDVGIGESWTDGDWSSPDLVAVVRVCIKNLAALEASSRIMGGVRSVLDKVEHLLRNNSVNGSRRNIRAHYDLSNDFFRLFLDQGMMYSSAYYPTADSSLDEAQSEKLDLICRKLQLSPHEHVLEIGTGWGGFADHAVRHYGCRVTTTTISQQQYDYARLRLEDTPGVELLLEDYRNLRGQYDKIVSIEMFEAVGLRYYDQFFRGCDRLLRSDGSLLLQTITMNEQKFPAYRRGTDWIQKHIFPGSELASVSEILRSLGRVTSLSMHHAEDIGTHYAKTLHDWRERFHDALQEVCALGFGTEFSRMWDYYLAYCEGAFLERHIGALQILMTKQHNPRVMFNEPRRAEQNQLQNTN
jgi:cyclopropane-fatty-acyl-phospholipid synthase